MSTRPFNCFLPFMIAVMIPVVAQSQQSKIDTTRGDKMIAEYFANETAKLRDACLADINSLEDWKANRKKYHQQLLEMLGLDPLPERTDLKAKITGKVEHEEFVVERLQYQSRPGLYVTGNLYVPKKLDGPVPAILYVCGHGRVKKGDVSFGNKVHYQHHGAWFARNGYVCLTIDTLQLGEIEGIHHGTYSHDMFWWLNRGYTPAGVEAWNCVRALDYLQSRKEVDGKRLGVTGRSGGGAYSWWIAAIDDRIKCAVPVAGITDLQNHVYAGMPGRFETGCVEGHCDCMFMLNTYRWDYPMVAALVAPRPLLISNTDTDGIFPLDGVYRTFEKTRTIYRLHDAADKVALQITAGGHKDTQELRVHAFRWFNKHLKGQDDLVDKQAVKFFEPEQLKVLDDLPEDQRNTEIHESFVTKADSISVPKTKDEWKQMRDGWRKSLVEKSFRGWPKSQPDLNTKEVFSVDRHGLTFRAIDFTSQDAIRLRLYVAHRTGLDKADLVVLNILDEHEWTEFLASMRPGFEEELKGEQLPELNDELFKQTQSMFKSFKWAMAYIAPRGIGPTAWDQSKKKQTQHRRRFYLLGQTLDGMRVWDVQQATRTLRSLNNMKNIPLWLQSHRRMAGVTLYGSLFVPEVTRLDLHELPLTHRDGPCLLNVRRFLGMPQTVAMVAERSRVVVYQKDKTGWDGWDYAQQTLEALDWSKKQLQVRKLPKSDDGR